MHKILLFTDRDIKTILIYNLVLSRVLFIYCSFINKIYSDL